MAPSILFTEAPLSTNTRRAGAPTAESRATIRCGGDACGTGHAITLPLMPTFIAPQDAAEKQDCERSAAKRSLAFHGVELKDERRLSRQRPFRLPANR